MESVAVKMSEILGSLIDPEFIEKSGINKYDNFISHLKIDLMLMLINHLYQRIAVLWRVVETYIVS